MNHPDPAYNSYNLGWWCEHCRAWVSPGENRPPQRGHPRGGRGLVVGKGFNTYQASLHKAKPEGGKGLGDTLPLPEAPGEERAPGASHQEGEKRAKAEGEALFSRT